MDGAPAANERETRPRSVFGSAATWYWGVAFALACYAFVVSSSPDNPRAGPPIMLWVVLAIAVCAPVSAIWRNRHWLASSTAPILAIRALGGVLATWLALFLCFIPVALVAPMHGDYTSRAKFTEVLLGASTLRTEITERAQRQRDLAGAGDGLRIEPGGKISAGIVSTNGAVVVYSEVLGAIAVLVPQMSGEGVNWRCAAMPQKIAPGSCRTRELLPESTSFERGIGGSEVVHAAALHEIAVPYQAEVAAAVAAGKPPRTSVRERQLAASDPLDFGYMSGDGIIALYSDRHGVYLQLTPSLQGKRVSWDCIAYPARAAPKNCRSPGTAR